MQVRIALPDDASALAQLCEAHAEFERIAYQPDGHAARLRAALQAQNLQVWLAIRDGRAVGYASVTQDFATLSALPLLHLDCLYLEPDARGRGIGEMLMRAALQFGHERGCATAQWQTPFWNQAALRFYDRLGADRQIKQRYTLALQSTDIGRA